MNWGLLLVRLLICIATGWMLGEAIKDYKAGRYHFFGIDLMFFTTMFIGLVINLILGYLI